MNDNIERARAEVRALFENNRALRPGCGEARATLHTVPYNPSTEEIDALVADARHDWFAWRQCQWLIKWLSQNDRPLPPSLAAWAVQATSSEKRPPKPGPKTAARNSLIRLAVFVAGFTLPKYAGDDKRSAPDTYTACDVVAEELARHDVELSPETIKDIWKAAPL